MKEETRIRWEKLFAMQAESGERVKDFCKRTGIHYTQFYLQYRKLMGRSYRLSKNPVSCSALISHKDMEYKPELFIELAPCPQSPLPAQSQEIKILYRDLRFELVEGFDAETFKRALVAVREVL